METREGVVGAGLTAIGAEVPSNFHVAARTENPTQVAGTPRAIVSQMEIGSGINMGKKKRGRPRKYGPDGSLAKAFLPMPISSSAPPPSTGNFPVNKRIRGRPAGSETKQHKKLGLENSGELMACSVGGNFMTHLITVEKGEDVTTKILSFTQHGPRAICIISAVGLVSNATLRQPDSSGGTLTYEGRFEMLSLSGSFTPVEVGGVHVSRSGGLSVTLASPDGRVVGGLVAGLLRAAGPVQVVVGSFLPSGNQEQKPKKQKTEPNLAPSGPSPVSTFHTNMDKDGYSMHAENSSAVPRTSFPPTLHAENWASMGSAQDSRNATDINISLHGD